ncbi:MAG TPA: HAMP domain-containing sensor histidine kinase [Skermanella sp.]|jgi:signal transduction histidine kinase|nr:HAMP domain-containing sensor histidine kinase [Skermanella sp.]
MMEVRRSPVVQVLLMAMPLLIIGVLAFRAGEADRAALKAEQAEAAAIRLHRLDEAAGAAVNRLVAEAVDRVAGTLSASPDPVNALHSLILSGTIDFAMAEEAGHRLFPSEGDPPPLLVEERKLQVLAGALAALRTEMAASDDEPATAWRWIAEEDGQALLHCRRDPPERILCVLLGSARIRLAVRAALDDLTAKGDTWTMSVADGTGARIWPQADISAGTLDATLRLADPLRSWQAEARRSPGAAMSQRRWSVLITIVAPLLASWLVLAWISHRLERRRREEGRQRAETAAQLSHDLRTPLANLRLYAELIARKADDPVATREYSRIVEAEVARLSLLADNAVAFAKGEAEEMTDHGTAIPEEVLGSILTRLSPLLDAAGCSAAVKAESAGVIAFGRSAYERITTNVLDNACKYAPGSTIDVATWVEGNRLMISVRDYGPGFSPEPAGSFRVARQRGSRGGFGLGLETIRSLARANGGDAWIENASPGARVTAWIRCAPAQPDLT